MEMRLNSQNFEITAYIMITIDIRLLYTIVGCTAQFFASFYAYFFIVLLRLRSLT